MNSLFEWQGWLSAGPKMVMLDLSRVVAIEVHRLDTAILRETPDRPGRTACSVEARVAFAEGGSILLKAESVTEQGPGKPNGGFEPARDQLEALYKRWERTMVDRMMRNHNGYR